VRWRQLADNRALLKRYDDTYALLMPETQLRQMVVEAARR
jgi:hypothetical protein